MKFRESSWHVRLNRFAFGKNVRLNPNLCPYFWKTIFAALFMPFSVSGFVIRKILEKMEEKAGQQISSPFKTLSTETLEYEYDSNFFIGTLGIAIFALIFGGLFVVFYLMWGIITSGAGIVLMIGLAILGALFAGGATSDLWSPMLVAAYKSVCPAIEWTMDVTPSEEGEVIEEIIPEIPAGAEDEALISE